MFILDSVANYVPKDDRETQSICERITPRLAHANSAVVLSAVKVSFRSFTSQNKQLSREMTSYDCSNVCLGSGQVIMKLMEMMEHNSDYIHTLVKKLSPPLVTLLSAEPEIQYVALRNINLIVQKR